IDSNGIESSKGYFYKILPFDDFGSGYLYEVEDKVLVWPRSYSDQTENGIPGPVISLTEDAIPQGVLGFTGDTAFTTYFLHWNIPGSQVLDNNIVSVPPNDLSYYEVWSGDSQVLQKLNENFTAEDNDSGYRRVEGDITSVIGTLDEVNYKLDPGLSITNAKNIFNVPASSPSIETSCIGNQGDIAYFWVRAVDKAGNKSPFVGTEDSDNNYINGLKLELAGVKTTDLVGFQENITSQFRNTPAIVSSKGNNPFEILDGALQWIAHTVWLNGVSYSIASGSEDDFNKKYVYWDPDPSTSLNSYQTSTENPDDKSDKGFIVATFTETTVNTSYHAFANALIGTAQISDAAITNAKIQDLTADKITAGEGLIAELEISNPGKIKSAGFDRESSNQGFELNNDGSFIFRGADNAGSLSFNDQGVLELRGLLRQTDGSQMDFIDIFATPSYFNYVQNEEDQYELENNNSIKIGTIFRNTSINSDQVNFRMGVIDPVDGVEKEVFSYQDFVDSEINGFYDISGFT
ncbi:hypothetical protein EB155_09950, partial [archaeon]|nr:hypothetical protein [archaeon]